MTIRMEYLGPQQLQTSSVGLIRLYQDNGDALPAGFPKAALQRLVFDYPSVTVEWFSRTGQSWGTVFSTEPEDILLVSDVTATIAGFVYCPDSERYYSVSIPAGGANLTGVMNLVLGTTLVDAPVIVPILVADVSDLSEIHAVLLNDQIIDDAAKTLHIRTADKTANQFSFTLKDAQGLPSIREVMRKERVI